MRVFVTGGTGFVGRALTRNLAEAGFQVTILTRSAEKSQAFPEGVQLLEGSPVQPGYWQESVREHEAIINLAGASIFTRWNDETKKLIRESRVLTTRNIIDALEAGKGKVRSLLSASAVGYYGSHGDEVLSEDSPNGSDFLASVASEWEAVALEAGKLDVRVALCRFGLVLGRDGGVLNKLVPFFRFYLGSRFGNGKQWFSWIHEVDLDNIILFLLKRENIAGPINCTAPNPVQNAEMVRILSEVLEKPTILPSIPEFVLRLVAGEIGSILLTGQRAVPQKLLDNGFVFRFPTLRESLQNLFEP